MEFEDRYSALGIKPPPVILACRAGCQALGVRPMKVGNSGNLDEDVAFVACPDCDGTGRAPGHPLLVILRRLPGELRRKVEFLRHYLFSRESWCPDRSTWWNVRLVLRVAVASW